jgi:ubiquinone/menaquinone biosynthesis C-methylase UbiE
MSHQDDVTRHFDQLAADYDRLIAKSHYYHEALIRSLREVIPQGARVLDIGTATGDMLAALEPSYGVGIDISEHMIERARGKHPNLHFLAANILDSPIHEQFDYVMSVNVMEHVTDIKGATAAMATVLNPGGKMLNITPHPAWAFPFYVAERFELKVPEGWHEWRTRRQLIEAGTTAGLELVFFDRDFLFPRHTPLLGALNSAGWAAPLRRALGVIQRVVFERPPR